MGTAGAAGGGGGGATLWGGAGGGREPLDDVTLEGAGLGLGFGVGVGVEVVTETGEATFPGKARTVGFGLLPLGF